ncbi:PiggyBac transposable element-derived protein 3 [Araneus ventricosus]|uniref:PiggyBac transposable element-derived protein 3 n=1 Tax=Araneus ventricosus TaxID=182803 RepID=A0A4Y2RTM9_ARAVE|nr:PiggyBac transposable element-derived protein 3 [Araneus ventricosus]GBN52442.1 PiggyBac transposable element-derived protein 3 [Araneus ventricosus]GBN79073.1 PiggyBac transposable element-derived protein 3 [Araneus ventricosus]GBN82433.1 PiggyBac transposable element-derived protein 3 [Araneus ventricosus]
MPVKRFAWILGNLHLNDNTLAKKRGDTDFDKLHKLRPLITDLSEKFLSVLRPTKHQASDEYMVKFKGRRTLKQYMPQKPITRGYKIWMRCDECGFASQFQIYTGKTKEVERNLGERVERDLTQTICGKNHILYMDNYFSSYNLFKFLEAQKIFSCGTINMSRKNLAKLAEDKSLNRGEFDWAVSNDSITCIKWKDKRCVSILSCLADCTDAVVIKQKEKNGEIIEVQCPKAVCDYNKNMGFVNHFDHFKSLYEIDRKSKKWWQRLFFHFLDMVTINAYIVYKMLPNIEEDMKNFRMEIIRSIIIMGKEGRIKKRRLSTPTLIKSHKFHVPDDTRLDKAEHLPVKCKSSRCDLCSTKQKPRRT